MCPHFDKPRACGVDHQTSLESGQPHLSTAHTRAQPVRALTRTGVPLSQPHSTPLSHLRPPRPARAACPGRYPGWSRSRGRPCRRGSLCLCWACGVKRERKRERRVRERRGNPNAIPPHDSLDKKKSLLLSLLSSPHSPTTQPCVSLPPPPSSWLPLAWLPSPVRVPPTSRRTRRRR